LTPRLRISVSTLVHNRRPFALLDPEAEAVALALERDPDRDVDGPLAHDLLVADRNLGRQLSPRPQSNAIAFGPQPRLPCLRSKRVFDSTPRTVRAHALANFGAVWYSRARVKPEVCTRRTRGKPGAEFSAPTRPEPTARRKGPLDTAGPRSKVKTGF
jgi:hypothetical protein